jgi:TM2 domain-containing membrane protein YozV
MSATSLPSIDPETILPGAPDVTERWFYARDGRRQGPVPRERLVDMAREGWLTPEDLVWSEGMTEWVPARSCDWLWGGTITRTVHDLVDATLHPERHPRSRPHPLAERPPLIDWEALAPRHLVATAGAFLAALGIAFTAIAHSRLALGLTLGGLFLSALGMHVEVGRLLVQVKENLAKGAAERAARRLEEERLALERRRFELEAERIAAERAATAPSPVETTPPTSAPAESTPARPEPSESADRLDEPGDDRIVIYHLPVRRWSPGVAAILSLFVPGLGQLYKGQFFNAVVWFVVVAAGYVALVIPGLILHACCILGALGGNPWTDPMTTYEPRPAHWPAAKRGKRKRRTGRDRDRRDQDGDGA